MTPKLVLDFLWSTKPPSVWRMSYFNTSNSACLKCSPLPPSLMGTTAPELRRLSCYFSTEMSDCVNSFLSICSFPISLLSAISGPLSTLFLGGSWEPSNWSPCLWFLPCLSSQSPHELPTRVHSWCMAVTLPYSNVFNDSYWLIHSYFPAWHSRPLSFGTKCSPAFFPTWCLYRSVPTQLGSLPFLKYAPCFSVLLPSPLSQCLLPFSLIETPHPSRTFLKKESLQVKGTSSSSNYQNILFWHLPHSYFCVFYFLTYKTESERKRTRSFCCWLLHSL